MLKKNKALHYIILEWIVHKVRGDSVLVFAIATALSQIFPLISAPVLSRLYAPSEFGSYAIYFALSSILGSAALLSMHNAIIIEEDDRNALVAFGVALIPPFFFAILLFAALFLLRPLLNIDFLAGLGGLLFFIPVTIIVSSVYLAGYTWLLRKGSYRTLAVNKLVLAASTMLLQIGVGLLHMGVLGFITANILGYLLAVLLVYIRIFRQEQVLLHVPNFATIRSVFRKHKASALFTTPANLLNSVCSYLPDFLIARLYGSTVLGHYSLGMRMVSMPLGFISTTVQDVFRREVSREQASTGQCRKTFLKYFGLMTIVSFLVLAPLIVVLPRVFALVLGDVWTVSGIYVQNIALLLIVRFISSPLSYVWMVTGKQRLDMIWQFGLLILTAGSFLLPEKIIGAALAPEMQFRIFGVVLAAWYLIALFFSYQWSRSNEYFRK